MYCGKNRTALASQEQIAKAAMELLERKSYGQISVSELCKVAQVSRQTFYSLFESKDNVMVFILQERYCYEPAPEETYLTCLEQLCRSLCRYIRDQRDFIRRLEQNHITYLLCDSFRNALTMCPCFLGNLPSQVRPYAINFLAGGFTSIAQTYVQDETDIDEDLLYHICLDLFHGRGLPEEDQ